MCVYLAAFDNSPTCLLNQKPTEIPPFYSDNTIRALGQHLLTTLLCGTLALLACALRLFQRQTAGSRSVQLASDHSEKGLVRDGVQALFWTALLFLMVGVDKLCELIDPKVYGINR